MTEENWFFRLSRYQGRLLAAIECGELDIVPAVRRNEVLAFVRGGDDYQRWWAGAERVHVVGKGIVRFHAVHWPALLLSAGRPLPTRLFVHDYLTVGGEDRQVRRHRGRPGAVGRRCRHRRRPLVVAARARPGRAGLVRATVLRTARTVAAEVEPFLPGGSARLLDQLRDGSAAAPAFPRLD